MDNAEFFKFYYRTNCITMLKNNNHKHGGYVARTGNFGLKKTAKKLPLIMLR